MAAVEMVFGRSCGRRCLAAVSWACVVLGNSVARTPGGGWGATGVALGNLERSRNGGKALRVSAWVRAGSVVWKRFFCGERQLAGNRAHGRFGSGNQKMSVRLVSKS